MESFAKEVNNFAKSSILDVWLGYEYASEIVKNRLQKTSCKNCKYERWNWGSMQLPLTHDRGHYHIETSLLIWIAKGTSKGAIFMDDAVSKGGSFVFRAFILRAFILCTFILHFVQLGYILYFKIIQNRFCQMLNRSWGCLLQGALVFIWEKYLIIFFLFWQVAPASYRGQMLNRKFVVPMPENSIAFKV